MSDLFPCEKCNEMRECSVIETTDTSVVKGKVVKYRSEYMKCSVCGCLFQTPEQLDNSLLSARIAYDNLNISVLPMDIIKIREKYNASQKAFGVLLGMGELTINSYEQGKIPSSAHRTLLELSKNPYCFYEMYNLNKDKISNLQRKKICKNEFFINFKEIWDAYEIMYMNVECYVDELLSTKISVQCDDIIQRNVTINKKENYVDYIVDDNYKDSIAA